MKYQQLFLHVGANFWVQDCDITYLFMGRQLVDVGLIKMVKSSSWFLLVPITTQMRCAIGATITVIIDLVFEYKQVTILNFVITVGLYLAAAAVDSNFYGKTDQSIIAMTNDNIGDS